MIIILFLHLLFGLWFAYRTYISSSQSLFPDFAIKSCILIYLILLALLSQTTTLWLIIGIHLPIFIFIIAEYTWIRKRKQIFRQKFSSLLEAVITRMKMGHSFRESLKLGIDSIESNPIKEDFKELRDRMIYSQNPGTYTPKDQLFVFKIFQNADRDPQPITHLRYIQHTLKVESKFQQKARQALLQIHIQSIILTLLYIALFIFVILFFGTQFLFLLSLSLFLFSIGTMIVFITGKNIKWTL